MTQWLLQMAHPELCRMFTHPSNRMGVSVSSELRSIWLRLIKQVVNTSKSRSKQSESSCFIPFPSLHGKRPTSSNSNPDQLSFKWNRKHRRVTINPLQETQSLMTAALDSCGHCRADQSLGGPGLEPPLCPGRYKIVTWRLVTESLIKDEVNSRFLKDGGGISKIANPIPSGCVHDGRPEELQSFTEVMLRLYIPIVIFLDVFLCRGYQVRSNSYTSLSSVRPYSPVSAPMSLVTSEVECAAHCTTDQHCVLFGYSDQYKECTLAGLPPTPPSPHTVRTDAILYQADYGCVGQDLVYFESISKCVEKLSLTSNDWNTYKAVCMSRDPGSRLLELSAPAEFHYTLSAVFASDFFQAGNLWLGARGQSDDDEHNLVWVTHSLPVNPSFLNGTVSPGDGEDEVEDEVEGEKDDDDDDDDETTLCGYLQKTEVAVYFRTAPCSAVGQGDFSALCERLVGTNS
ncbi:hypothetical protein RRG08_062696 [Elysia crispata]|uniref:Apple domain-containing protein n=1 Tax=Elysia crispata TaxID=231223 RepID=A0AAE1DVV4_9GAST|nr:hypothetical protein RRG08_062696 [Elysia crispata]